MNTLLYRTIAYLMSVMPVRWNRSYLKQNARSSTHQITVKKQILVDVSVIYQSDARTGIQRVVRALFGQLILNPPMGYLIRPVYASRKDSYRYAAADFLEHSFEEAHGEETPVEVNSGDIFLGLDLAAHLLPLHQHQLLKWKLQGAKLHVLVYDLLPLQHPQWFNPSTSKNFKRWIRWMAQYADSAICISATVKTELESIFQEQYNLRIDEPCVRTIPMGADIQTSHPSTGLLLNYETLIAKMRTTRSVLVVGTLEPRKGHEQVLDAFELLWEHTEAPLLIFVGKPGWKTHALQARIRGHCQAGRKLYWLENASDEMLNLLYLESWGLLAASKAEGFGLPIIEAAILNKPVLARDLPVFREITLPNISYFHAETASQLALAISDWMAQFHKILPTNAQIKSYSWESVAQHLMLQLQPNACNNLALK